MGLNEELFEAVKKEGVEEVRKLLENGADVNAKDNDGYTPLHYAAIKNKVDFARLLVEKGADVNAKSNDGITPLHVAAWGGHVDVARFLVENGADVNAKNDDWTPLHYAAIKNKVDFARLLVEKGADVNAKSNDGYTPLHVAAVGGHVDFARLLVENGADVNAEDNDGKTPIDIARKKGHNDIVKLLERAREEAALHPLKLLGFEQDGIEAGKWGRLRIKLRANKPITVRVDLSGDVDWISPGERELSGKSFIEVPVKPKSLGEIPVKVTVNSGEQSISEVFWLKPLPPPPEDLEWIESRIKEVKEFVRKIEEETLV